MGCTCSKLAMFYLSNIKNVMLFAIYAERGLKFVKQESLIKKLFIHLDLLHFHDLNLNKQFYQQEIFEMLQCAVWSEKIF